VPVRLLFGSTVNAPGEGAGVRVRGVPLVRVGTSATSHLLVAGAIVPMVAVTTWLALTSDHLAHPAGAALYWGWLTGASMAIGLYWWVRRPATRFGPLLVAFGTLAWLVSWQGSDRPLAFNLGVLAEAPMFVLTFYLFLAFPMGRLEPPAARWLIGALWLVVLGFFLPWALFSAELQGAGPLTRCATACPENALQIASIPNIVKLAGKAESYALPAITAAAFVVYLARLRTASRPQRRSLAAVAVTSLLYLPVYFVYSFAAWILLVDPATRETLSWGVAATRALLPLGFLVALLQAQRFAAKAQRTLLELLAARPTPEAWRDEIASVLDDNSLRLGYHDPVTETFREPDGEELTRPPSAARLAWVPIVHDEQPVAAMVIDETLAEDPELVRAAASATLVAVENGQLEGELRASRERVVEAGLAERQRLERDLHDSAQQRLVALRIHLSIAREQLGGSEEREMLERLGTEVDDAIDDLRAVAHGKYPQVLTERGVGAALADVARTAPMPVDVRDAWRGRHSEAVEVTVYFCCLECLQNAAKHAGGASVMVRLSEARDRVGFCVEDDGAGFDPGTVVRGAGLANLESRVAALGGTLDIDAGPGRGTRITGTLPG
jgi:signal transduction histidine kinase